MTRLTLKAKLIPTAALGVAFVIIVVLPLLLLSLPNPKAVKVPTMQSVKAGTFLDAGEGLYKLYPYASTQDKFPAGAPSVGRKPSVYVKYRQLDELPAYGIYAYPTNQAVPVSRKIEKSNVLRLAPESGLHTGLYYITAARDGIYGGTDYFYFKVRSVGKGRP
ncbi:MAG: hypothetical protein ACYC56_08340 [Candidatus Aquicultor sp.]